MNRRVNLHTHTALCKHGTGAVRDYCLEAQKAGLTVLGFSEHNPFPDGRFASTRMDYSEFPEYLRRICEAREEFPDLIILAGFEADVEPDIPLEFYRDELKERFGLDYLAGGVHSVHTHNGERRFVSTGKRKYLTADEIRAFADKNVLLMEQGIFDFITHPDMVAAGIKEWTPETEQILRRIPEAAERTGTPLEINAYGLRKPVLEYEDGPRRPYPWEPFWRMAAEYRISCVIGSDAHRPEDVSGNMDEAFALAEKFSVPCVNEALAKRILKRTVQQHSGEKSWNPKSPF